MIEPNRRKERGQFLVLFALGLVAILGFTALTIDAGMFYEDRRHLQNAADAAALAGAGELPSNPASAKGTARDWALKHGVDSSQIKSIEVRSILSANDTVYVELNQQFEWLFARVLGMTTAQVGATAAARVGTLQGTGNLMPWSIVQGDSDCLDSSGNAIFGQVCSVKVGAQSKYGGGWRGALDFDGKGGGANEYRDNIIDGQADTMYCIAGQAPPPCEASIVDIKNGNIVGPTEQGIKTRLAQGAKCDTNGNGVDDFTEVFVATGQASPTYTVNCPNSPWLLIIPIVEYNGGQTVIIKGWSLSYFETYYCVGDATCGGKGHWEVRVKIVDASYSQAAAFLGAYNPDGGVTLRKLVE